MELLQSLITFVIFIAILGGLVLVHEIGHFVTARLAGVRVLEFGIGFPPRAKVLRTTGETLYTLNWLPIGGFVKLEGEDGDEGDDPRSFVRARLPVKLVILLAGVFMNLVTALVIFTLIAWVATPLIGVRAPTVEPGSPAAAAGIRSGDAIIAIDGQKYEFFAQYVGAPDVLDDLRAHAGETIVIGVHRADGTFEEVTATLRTPAQVAAGEGALGIRATEESPFVTDFYGETVGHDLGTAFRIGVDETGRWFGLILAGLGDLVGNFVSNPTAPPPVAGPVGIATQIGDIFWGSGPILTLYVAAILSANLALVNALPFPPLDGGRILMILLKSVFGARLSLRAERLTYFVGFVFLFAFLIWVTGFDIVRIFGGGS
jgi:regulator of sigma E protease